MIWLDFQRGRFLLRVADDY